MTNRLSAANPVARSAAFARAQRNPRLSPFRQRRGGAMRAVRPAPLTLLAALALLAILGALFVPDRAQAQAQVLVSNLGQTKTGQSALRNGDRLGQTFSIAPTGGASYYTLSSIEIPFARNGIAATDMGLLTVSLWSIHASGANAGQPDSLLYTLTNPESVAADAAATFAAPADLTLAAGRTYAVVVVYSKTITTADIADAPYWVYAGTGEDADPAPGWSVADLSHSSAAGATSWSETATRAQKIRVNGTAVQPDVLVSNLGQTKTGQLILRNGDRSGQTFSIATTGEASYYTLSSIEILFSTNGIASTDMGLLTVSLWSIHASGANAGQPDSLLYTLTNPASVTADAAATFAAPADVRLAAGKTYAVVVVYSKTIATADIADAPFWEYAGTGEDADPAPGWSIADLSHSSAAGATSWSETANRAQKISVNGNETINNDPVFASTAETREVAENSAAGTNVGAVISEATDADDDTLTYSMEGANEASFDFDASTRQITTKTGVTYNYEATKNTYSVTVTADDGNDSTATVAVTINLTDVAEKSAKPAKPRLAAVTGTPTSLTATWRKPGLNGGPEITGYNLQYKLSSASMWSDFTHSGTEVTATITGLTAGMSYQVRVQAKNGETDSDWSDASDAQNTTPTPTPDATITSLLSRLDVELRETEQHTASYDSHGAGYNTSINKVHGTLSPAGFNYPAGFGPWYTVQALVSSQEGPSGKAVSTGLNLVVRGQVTSVASSGTHRAHVLPSGASITLHLEGDDFSKSYSLESAESAMRRTVTKCTPEDGIERHCMVGETANEDYGWDSNLPPRLTDGDSILVRLRYKAPRPGKPGTPTVTVPTGKSGALIVNWTAPSSNNPAVLGYHVHVTRGSQLRPKSVDASTTRLPVLLLEPDTAYDVRVRARTALATGPWSGTARARTNPLQGTNRPQVTLDLNGVTKVKERDGLPMRLKVTGMPNLHAGAFPERFEGEKQLSGVEFLLLDRIAKVYTYEDHPGGCGGGSFRSGALTIGDDGEVYHDSGYLVIPAGMSAFGPLYVELDTRCGNTRSSGGVSIDTTERHCVEIADSSNTVLTGRTCPSGGMPGHAVDRLTARFVGVPRSHDGESEFTLRVAFIEDVGISPTSLREDALTVTGGTVTQAQRVDDRSDLFEITVEPASDEDVTITLAAGSDCAAAGAICTGGEDPKTLYNSPTATVSGPTLTASFQGLPSQHDGETAFSFRIAFSEEIATGEEEFRDHSVEVWGGRVTRAEPVDQRRDLWEVEVEPASDDLVMVSLRPSLSCDETGAVCTAGGRRLSVSPATMVAGPSTWPVQVNGEAQVGKTLTADPSNISDRFGVQVTSMTYQWLANNARMPGAGGSTYTPGEGKQGKKISVMATYTDDRGNEDTVASGPTDPVAARERNSRATGLPLISGRALVGQTLTADPSLIFDADGLENSVFSYLWEADDDSIPGATDPTYTPVQADVGKVITVIVSFLDDAGYGQSMTSPATLAVTTAEAAAAVKFAISLRYAANADGSVSLYWNAPDDEATGYRIDRRRYSMGEPKGLVYVEDTGSAATAYTDIEVTAGAPHSYRVQAIRGAELGEKTKFFKTKVFPLRKAVNSPATGSSAISGVAQVGETLTADTSGIVDADGLEHITHNYLWGISGSAVIGAVYGYQWLADGAEIEDATGSTYILADADEGKAIRVRVSFTDDGGHRETLTSSATAAVTQPNTPATGLPTVSGKARVGETLTVDTSGIYDENGLEDATFTHRWITDDSVVVGAGTRAYTPTGGDQGKAVKVRVSFSDDAGNWETRTSAETAAVEARANSPATGLPTISGTAVIGETLTADTSGIQDANGLDNVAFHYQWLGDDSAIDRAAGITYTLADSDKDKTIRVRVTFTDDAGNWETRTSAQTAAVLEEPVLGDGPPGAPGNLTITAGDREITLSWEPPADNGNLPATRYRIEWRMDGKDYKKGHWGTAGSTTYTKTDLANGVKYIFRVKAENGSGNSYGPYGPASGEVSATPTSGSAVDLGTPVLSNTETLHHGMVKLDWEDVEDAGWYVVQYYHVKSGEWLDLPAAGVDIAFHGSSAVVSNLHGLSWLRVRAMSCAGESEWSQIEELYGTRASDWEDAPVPEVAEGDQIDPCPVILGTPVLSNTKTLHHGMVRLDWQDIEDAGWYVVQYYHVKSGEWLDLPTAGVDIAFHGSSAVVSDLHGLSWLRVRAVSCDGASEWSQIEELYGTNASDWKDVPVPEVAEGDEIEPCSEDADTPDNSPATGAPTISGTVQVGETLMANTSGIADADGLSNVQYEYQWLADDAEIAGATGLTYTLAATDEGKAIMVQVGFTDDESNEESLTSAATDAVAAAPQSNSPATGEPTITGTVQVGETLTANTSGVADVDGLSNVRYEYQWLADDNDIAGASGLTYTLTDSEESKAITVQVSFTDDADNEETLTSAATAAVAAAPAPNSPATGAPTINGTVQVGETLTANTSGIADADGLGSVQYEYQWLADDSEISGATSVTYTLADTDEGKAIKVEVSFTDDAGNGETLTSAATDAVAAAAALNSPATGAPTISGTAQVGETLTANTSGVADADGLGNVRYEYQWLADDNDIAGASGLTYTLTDSEESKAITVQVSFTDAADNEETLTSAATAAVASAPTPNSPATGAPTISGTVQVGETLTANTSGVADADGLGNVQYEYQWLADAAEISGATSVTYTLADTDEGKAIKVEVSFTDDAGNGETLTSAATGAVAVEPSEPPDKPKGLDATATHDSVTLTWDDPQDESITGYVILRRVRVNDQGGDFQCIGGEHGERRHHLHRQRGGGQHHLHLPHQGHQQARNE